MTTSANAYRASFYGLLSLIYEKELSSDMISALAGADFGQLAGADKVSAFFAQNLANLEDELAADFAKVFLAAGEAKGKAAFPYESVYTSDAHLVMQEAWVSMCALLKSKGLQVDGATKEIKEDHLAAQLKYMAYLCENADAKEQAAFLDEHVLNWIDAFAADVEKYAGLDFYKGIAAMTAAFVKEDRALLDEAEDEATDGAAASFELSYDEMDAVLAKWREKYRVYAPKKMTTRSSKEMIRYQEIKSVADICNERNSDFSPKEIYYPISQTMFYFTESEVIESQMKDEKKAIILAHPCDINAMRRLDSIFLTNGGNEDLYYKRMRDKVKMVLLECNGSSEHCYCVSMGSNVAEDYEMAIRLGADSVSVQVKEPVWVDSFKGSKSSDFAPVFVTENKRTVKTPVINDVETLKIASTLPYWNKFDENCISCGGCNTVCPTCSCFDTVDIIYDETSRDGERRRVWSSCMLDTYTMTAGGARARKTPGANMRFKTLHKVYDYQKRFGTGENMCVGCGRCILRCPKEIDFSATLNEFTDALEAAVSEGGATNA